MTRCPMAVSGEHEIEWLDVPGAEWVGGSDFGGRDVPPHKRGFCWLCDQRFTKGA